MPFFAHPLLLGALVLAGLVPLIHGLGRPPPVQIFLATAHLTDAKGRAATGRRRIERPWLMVARLIALLAAITAIARPQLRAAAVAQGPGYDHLVLVVDTSGSMGYKLHGTTLLATARQLALKHVEALAQGGHAALVWAGNGSSYVAGKKTRDIAASANHAQLLAALANLPRPAGHADLNRAMARAAAVAQDLQRLGPVQVVVISDFAQEPEAAPVMWPAELNLPIYNDAAGRDLLHAPRALPNVGLILVDLSYALQPDGQSFAVLTVEAKNFGLQQVSGREVQFFVGQDSAARGTFDLAAGETQHKVVRLLLPPQAEQVPLCVRLAPTSTDGLAQDDAACAMARPPHALQVVAVGAAGADTDDSLFFIERALWSAPAGELLPTLKIVAADALMATLATNPSPDVVLLADVGDLPNEASTALRDFVKAGHGLVFVGGAQMLEAAANEAQSDWLPFVLRDSQQRERQTQQPWHLQHRPHEVTRGLGEPLERALNASQTWTRLLLQRRPGVGPLDVALAYDDGAPALVSMKYGAGRIIFSTTGWDGQWSDFALRSAFLPLVQRTLAYAGGISLAHAPAALQLGDFATMQASATEGEVALRNAEGDIFTAQRSLDGADLRVGPLASVGVWQALTRHESGARWSRIPAQDVVVAPSLSESNFSVALPQVNRSASGDKTTETEQHTQRTGGIPSEGAHWLLALVSIAIAIEGILRRGRRRPA